jgi:hypothetical protein
MDEADGPDGVPRSGERLLQPAPQLQSFTWCNCSVVPDRIALLERLPKGGVVAEVGGFLANLREFCGS